MTCWMSRDARSVAAVQLLAYPARGHHELVEAPGMMGRTMTNGVKCTQVEAVSKHSYFLTAACSDGSRLALLHRV